MEGYGREGMMNLGHWYFMAKAPRAMVVILYDVHYDMRDWQEKKSGTSWRFEDMYTFNVSIDACTMIDCEDFVLYSGVKDEETLYCSNGEKRNISISYKHLISSLPRRGERFVGSGMKAENRVRDTHGGTNEHDAETTWHLASSREINRSFRVEKENGVWTTRYIHNKCLNLYVWLQARPWRRSGSYVPAPNSWSTGGHPSPF